MAAKRFIVQRLGVGFALTLVLVGGVAAVSLLALQRYMESTQNWIQELARDVVLAERLRANLHARGQAGQTMLLTGEANEYAQIELLRREFDQLLGELRSRAEAPARVELLDQLARREQALRDAGDEALRRFRMNDPEGAREAYVQLVVPARTQVEEITAAMGHSATERMQNGLEDLRARGQTQLVILAIAAVLAVAIGCAISFVFASGVRQFENQLRASADQADRRMRQLHAVLSASSEQVFLVDRRLAVQFASAAALRGLGKSASEVVGRPVTHLNLMGPGSEQVVGDLQHVVGTGNATRGQAFITLPSGYSCFEYEVCPVLDGGRVEAVVLSARDVTERWRNEESLRDWSTRVITILESITDAFLAIDRNWRYTYANHEAERLFGMTRDQIEGREMWELLPELVDSPIEAVFRRSLELGQRADLEEYIQPMGRWLEIHLFPSPMGLSVYFRDITDRKRVEAHQRLLSASGAVLGSSLDLEEVVHKTIRVPLAGLADFTVFWPEPDVGPSAPELAHSEEIQEPLLRDAALSGPQWPPPSPEENDAGVPQLITEVQSHHLDAWAGDLAQRKRLASLRIRSIIRVPLIAAGQRMGCLVLARTGDNPSFDDRDLMLAQDFASRAGMAVKTAYLYAQSQQAIRSREDVLAVVSHDLRSPLNALRLTAQQLERAPDERLAPERVRRLAQRMRVAGDRMNRLIRDLLDLAAAQAGALRLERDAFKALDIARAAAEMVQPIADEKGLELRVAGDGRVWVDCDRERVLQILSNLLGNAIRFSPVAAPLVIQVEPLDGHVRFSVIDRGPGIPADQKELVFDRFWHAGAKGGGGAGGTGLGLSIVKSLVQAHGGEVGVDSEPGAGSTFHFTLLRVDPPPGAGLTATTPAVLH